MAEYKEEGKHEGMSNEDKVHREVVESMMGVVKDTRLVESRREAMGEVKYDNRIERG